MLNSAFELRLFILLLQPMIQIPSDNIQRLQNLVMKANTIAVVTHTNPDGDTVGASLAIALMMRKLGKKALVIAPDNVPDFLSWLPELRIYCALTLRFKKLKNSCLRLI